MEAANTQRIGADTWCVSVHGVGTVKEKSVSDVVGVQTPCLYNHLGTGTGEQPSSVPAPHKYI